MTAKFRIIVSIISLVGLVGLWGVYRGYRKVDDFSSLENYGLHLRKEYPELEFIAPGTLSALLRSRDASIESLLLVDCRSEKEFAISRIPGAIHLESAEAIRTALRGSGGPSPDQLVLYCAVGNRAAPLAESLRNDGITGAKVLNGGVFAWITENRPLVDGEGNPAGRIHPYKKFWSRLLEEDHIAGKEIRNSTDQ